MSNDPQLPTLQLLKAFQARFAAAGIPHEFFEPSPEIPFHSLVVRMPDLGEAEVDLDLQLSFLPFGAEVDAAGVHVLQAYAELETDVPAANFAELLSFLARVNPNLPLGAMGLLADDGIVYFKYNSYVSSRVDLDLNAQLVDQQCGLILHQLSLFFDLTAAVANGTMSALEACLQLPVSGLS